MTKRHLLGAIKGNHSNDRLIGVPLQKNLGRVIEGKEVGKTGLYRMEGCKIKYYDGTQWNGRERRKKLGLMHQTLENVPCFSLQIFLWPATQWFFWQSREQYQAPLHLEQARNVAPTGVAFRSQCVHFVGSSPSYVHRSHVHSKPHPRKSAWRRLRFGWFTSKEKKSFFLFLQRLRLYDRKCASLW